MYKEVYKVGKPVVLLYCSAAEGLMTTHRSFTMTGSLSITVGCHHTNTKSSFFQSARREYLEQSSKYCGLCKFGKQLQESPG